MKRIIIAISVMILCSFSINISAAGRMMHMLARYKNTLVLGMGAVVAAENIPNVTKVAAQQVTPGTAEEKLLKEKIWLLRFKGYEHSLGLQKYDSIVLGQDFHALILRKSDNGLVREWLTIFENRHKDACFCYMEKLSNAPLGNTPEQTVEIRQVINELLPPAPEGRREDQCISLVPLRWYNEPRWRNDLRIIDADSIEITTTGLEGGSSQEEHDIQYAIVIGYENPAEVLEAELALANKKTHSEKSQHVKMISLVANHLRKIPGNVAKVTIGHRGRPPSEEVRGIGYCVVQKWVEPNVTEKAKIIQKAHDEILRDERLNVEPRSKSERLLRGWEAQGHVPRKLTAVVEVTVNNNAPSIVRDTLDPALKREEAQGPSYCSYEVR